MKKKQIPPSEKKLRNFQVKRPLVGPAGDLGKAPAKPVLEPGDAPIEKLPPKRPPLVSVERPGLPGTRPDLKPGEGPFVIGGEEPPPPSGGPLIFVGKPPELEADVAILAFVSDLHIGAGDATDDFDAQDDKYFIEMIDWLYKIGSTYGRPIELILLGDIFELWETTDFFQEDDPVQSKVDGAKEKITRIHAAHAGVFAKLAEFQQKGNKLIYVIGNHDDDVVNAQVQLHLKGRTGFADNENPKTNFFRESYINKDFQLLARHGHEYDEFNENKGFGNKPSGRIVTERISSALERYQVVLNRSRGANAPRVKGPFDKVDAAGTFRAYLDCLRTKNKLPQKEFIEAINKELDQVVDKSQNFPKKMLIAAIMAFVSNDPLDEIAALLTIQERHGDSPEPSEKEIEKLLGGDYECFVSGHTHTPFIRKFASKKLWINSGNWQDSGTVEGGSPDCFQESRHRNVTLLFKVVARSGSQVTEDLKGAKKVLAEIYSFPGPIKTGFRGEYDLD